MGADCRATELRKVTVSLPQLNCRTRRDSLKMKLFCIVLVIYVVALTLFGVDGRGGGTRNGSEEPLRGLLRARRHAPILTNEPPKGSVQVANEEEPPSSQFRARREAMKMNSQPEEEAPPQGANDKPPPPPQFRQRRQMPAPPPPPEGMPPPPEGMPPPPEGMPPPPSG